MQNVDKNHIFEEITYLNLMPELLMEMFFVSRNMLNILKNNGETDVHSVRRTVSVKQENNNIHYINICFPFCK